MTVRISSVGQVGTHKATFSNDVSRRGAETAESLAEMEESHELAVRRFRAPIYLSGVQSHLSASAPLREIFRV